MNIHASICIYTYVSVRSKHWLCFGKFILGKDIWARPAYFFHHGPWFLNQTTGTCSPGIRHTDLNPLTNTMNMYCIVMDVYVCKKQQNGCVCVCDVDWS